VNFNLIPSLMLTPGAIVEVDGSRATSGPGLFPYLCLIVGQKLGHAPAAANSIRIVSSADEVATLAGRGSMLHRQAIAWFAANKSSSVRIGVLADNSAGVIAEGTVTFAGTATAAGTISFYLGGNLVQVAVAVGDTAATIAAALATEIGKHAVGTITCAAADAADNVTIGGVLDGAAVSTTFVGTAGAVTPGAATYSIDTGNTEAAASLASQINAHATASRLVRASSALAVCTVRAVEQGTNGNAITLATTDVTDLAVSGATLTGGVAGENPDLPMHASVASAVVTLRANNAGAVGNELDLRMNYRTDSESTPAGITATLVQPSGGATNPVLTSLITAMGDVQYHVIAHPYTDATSLTALENELADRMGPLRAIEGQAISAKADTYANQIAFGATRNTAHSSVLDTDNSPTPPAEYAAHVAAVVALYAENEAGARPFQTLPLPYILAPAEGDRNSNAQRRLLLAAGIATTKVAAGDMVQIERLVTMYRLNAAGSPDTTFRDANTLFKLMYARANWRAKISEYSRHKLGNDSTAYPAGEAVMTPSLGRSVAVSWFLDMSTRSPVVFEPSMIDQFKTDLVVERNATDSDRMDWLLPPTLIAMLIVSAAQIQFRNR